MQSQGHFLDALPFTLSRPGALDLRDLLAAAYFSINTSRQIAESAELILGAINFEQAPDDRWFDILHAAAAQGRLRALVQHAEKDPKIRQYHARLAELRGPAPATSPPEGEGPLKKTDDEESGDELRIEDRPTLLGIAFLQEGLRVAPAVVRIEVTSGADSFAGTGFLISDDLILTNHHVLYPDGVKPGKAVEIWFGYELTFAGAAHVPDSYQGIASSITGDKPFDWAVVRLAEPLRKDYPRLGLEPSKPEVAVDDRVYIIQHPFGGPKQIALHHNDVRHVDEEVIHYRTDTEHGSSGSPVFNERWEVVALHHKWVSAGTIAGRRVYRNEGIQIGQVVEGLKRKGIVL